MQEINNFRIDNNKEISVNTGHVIKEDNMPKIRLIEGSIRMRKDGRFEGRIFREGKQLSVYAKTELECIKKTNELSSIIDFVYIVIAFFNKISYYKVKLNSFGQRKASFIYKSNSLIKV